MTRNSGKSHSDPLPGVARGYTRVSTDDQRRSGISLDVQENQIKAFYDYKLAPLGYRWGGVYRDEAVSGWKLPFIRRPAGSELHAQLRAGDYIIFAKLDRGFRSRRDADKMVHLWDDMDVNVRFLDLDVDLKSPFGRLLLGFFSAFAEWEYEIICERNRAVAAWRQQHNMPIGKHQAPVGYKWGGVPGKKVLVPAGNDRDIIDRLVEWRIAGSSLAAIAIHLQKLGLKTDAGREWTIRCVTRTFHKELGHLEKDGVVQRVGHSRSGKLLVLRWVTEKLPSDRLDRITKLYDSLGRKINDTAEEACDVNCALGLDGGTPGQDGSVALQPTEYIARSVTVQG